MASSFLLLPHVFLFCSLFLLLRAETFEWNDGFYYLKFGGSAPAPYVKYNPKLVSTKHKTYTNNDGQELGLYGSHMWAAPAFTYMLDLTNSGVSHVDLKMGFAEIYKLSCRFRGRSFDIHVDGKPELDVNIFALVRCLQPHDVIFHGVDATKPINITMVSRLGNPMISNLVARQSIVALTAAPPTSTEITATETADSTATEPVTLGAATATLASTEATATETTDSTTTEPVTLGAATATLASTEATATETTDSMTTAAVPLGTTTVTSTSTETTVMETTDSTTTEPITLGTATVTTTVTETNVAETTDSTTTEPVTLGTTTVTSTSTETNATETTDSTTTEPATLGTVTITLTTTDPTSTSVIEDEITATTATTALTTTTVPIITTTSTTTTTTTVQMVDKSQTTSISAPLSPIIPDQEGAIIINAGGGEVYDGIPETSVIKNMEVTVQNTVRPAFFSMSRVAKKFTYVFAGDGVSKYQIQLGFAETDPQYCSGEMDRVFSVFLNGDVVRDLKNVNVTDRVGCRHALIWTHPGVMISSRLYVTFEATKGNAMVSYIMVRKLPAQCVPESLAAGQTADHLAHSVPGEYPVVRSSSSRRSYPDADGNGYETVRINGDGSHTHFFDVNSGIVGRVTEYLWTSPDTTEFISDRTTFDFNFYKGTTRMFLAIKDNVCSEHTAETTVTVTGSVTGGSYCYFYSGESTLTEGEGIDIERKPDYAKWYPGMKWNFSGLPIAKAFSARCFFFLETAEDLNDITGMMKTTGRGVTSLLRGSEVILDHSTGTSFKVPLVASLTAFELRYVRKQEDVTPSVSIDIDAGISYKVLYDSSTIFPVITDLRPKQSDLDGLSSSSFLVIGPVQSPESFQIGSQSVPISRIQWSPKRVFFTVPSVNVSEEADVYLNWPGGITSNTLKFKYIGGPVEDAVDFQHYVMKEDSTGEKAKNEFATTVRIGSDGDIYMGTLGARVLRLKYDMEKMTVLSRCGSKRIVDPQFSKDGKPAQRDILGMVFDPRDTRPHPYVATQTLYWWDKDRIDRSNNMAWRNGAIERLKPGTDPNDPSICLVHDRKLISFLPISNHDHGTNGLEFTQEGDLLVSVGGFTNTGLPGKGLGLFWEVPLSATILKFKLSKGSSFNGEMRYTNDTHPQLGKALPGDYGVVATGIRNAFFLSLHSSGRLYTVDNGPNVGFGNVAAECSEMNTLPNYPPDPPYDYPGTVQVREGWKRFSLGRPDRLLWVKTDGTQRFYGHPHLHRGQCSWIDPFTHKDVHGRPPPANYDQQLLAVTSSVNAVIEYHASLFGGRLKGHLIMSTYKNRRTYAVPPITRPKEKQPVQLSRWGGLAAVMNAKGDVIIPRIQKNDILVLRPKIPKLQASEKLSVTAVTPFRYGRKGRTTATIYGYNFGTSGWIRVRIDGRICHIYKRRNNMIRCRVPWARRRGRLVDVYVSRGRGRRTWLKNGVWYMNA